MTVVPQSTARSPTLLVDALAASLDPEQRAAALLPDGPAQILAPAGSGKTTTLVARLGVLLARGVAAERILVLTFNRDAAAELSERIRSRLAAVNPDAGRIEVRTIHALGRQILLHAGRRFGVVADRSPLLRRARRRAAAARPDGSGIPDAEELDTLLSAWKLQGRTPDGAALAVITSYQRDLERQGLLDFDDLVAGALGLLDRSSAVRERWQGRFSHVLVDEFQDVDAAQARLISILAAPESNLFVVGDDDQTIYAWRLADVRRMIDFGAAYPHVERVVLATNYRCPPDVVAASRRLIEHNVERFPKRIESPAGRQATMPRVAGGQRPRSTVPAIATVATDRPDWATRLVELARGAVPGARVCFLARTRSELWPVELALVAAGVRHATRLAMPLDSAPVLELLEALGASLDEPVPPAVGLEHGRAARGWHRGNDALSADDHGAIDALIGWATRETSAAAFVGRCHETRGRVAALRDPTAPVEMVTVHGAKGREWEIVVIIGWERDRFPNRRAILGAADPRRAVEEERRLAYVALTRATRRLVLAFDPRRPTRFLEEMLAPSAGAPR